MKQINRTIDDIEVWAVDENLAQKYHCLYNEFQENEEKNLLKIHFSNKEVWGSLRISKVLLDDQAFLDAYLPDYIKSEVIRLSKKK